MTENYNITKKVLGAGTFGKVFLAEHKKTGEKVAIKECTVREDKHGITALREIKTFQRIDPHKHIVRMIDYSYENSAFFLIMEYCDKGDLIDYMKKYAPTTDKQLKIMHQCASAVAYMHSREEPVVHRDLKPANILFKTEGKSFVLKVADFGLAKIGDCSRMATVVGTEAFMAPEIMAKQSYNHTVDTFALGLIYLAMINFKPSDEYPLIPLSASFLEDPGDCEDFKFVGHEMYEANMKKSQQPIVVKISAKDSEQVKGIKQLILGMTNPVPSKRLAMSKVLKEIERIGAGKVSSDGMLAGVSASKVFSSNLDITRTRMDQMSTVAGLRDEGASKPPQGVSTVVPHERNPAAKTVTKPKSAPADIDEDEDEVPDIGYLLAKQMMVDKLKEKEKQKQKEAEKQKEKQEEEKKRRSGRMKALEEALDLPLLQLFRLLGNQSSDKFEVGDKVTIETDYNTAKSKQRNHGGWHEKMDRYLGKAGTVKKIRGGGMVEVLFQDGQAITWNEELLEQAHEHPSGKPDGTIKTSAFAMNDVVRIRVNAQELERLQRKGNTGWKEKQKKAIGIQGVVHRVHFDGDVLVEFMNHDKFWLSPDALEVVDMSQKKIEAGDQVIVIDDRRLVQELQKGHGEWVDTMVKCLGRSGIVRRVGSDRAEVEIDKDKFVWNVKCLKLIVKSEDMLLMMLQRALSDDD